MSKHSFPSAEILFSSRTFDIHLTNLTSLLSSQITLSSVSHFSPMFHLCMIYIPPGNAKNRWRFQRVRKWNIGNKSLNLICLLTLSTAPSSSVNKTTKPLFKKLPIPCLAIRAQLPPYPPAKLAEDGITTSKPSAKIH